MAEGHLPVDPGAHDPAHDPDRPTSHDPAQYGRSFADVYDDWYASPPDALVSFVADRVPAGGSVVELGVGTGRLAIPLAAAGLTVCGIDPSPEMLARLAANDPEGTVRAVAGDAADPAAYPSGQDAVLAAFNLLFNLGTEARQAACLRAAAGAVAEGGIVVVEAFVPDLADPTPRQDLVTRSVDDERAVLIATDFDPVAQVVRGGHIEVTTEGTRFRPWTVRVLSPAQIDGLATAAGLELVERYEDAAGTPFTDGVSVQHLSVYRRPHPSPEVGGGVGRVPG